MTTIKRFLAAFLLFAATASCTPAPEPIGKSTGAVQKSIGTPIVIDVYAGQLIGQLMMTLALPSNPINPSSSASFSFYYEAHDENQPDLGLFLEVSSTTKANCLFPCQWPWSLTRGYSLEGWVGYNHAAPVRVIQGFGFPGDNVTLEWNGPQMTGQSQSRFVIQNDNLSGVEASSYNVSTYTTVNYVDAILQPHITLGADDQYVAGVPAWEHNCWGDLPASTPNYKTYLDVMTAYVTADWSDNYGQVQSGVFKVPSLNPAVSGGPAGQSCNLTVGSAVNQYGQPVSHLTWYAGH